MNTIIKTNEPLTSNYSESLDRQYERRNGITHRDITSTWKPAKLPPYKIAEMDDIHILNTIRLSERYAILEDIGKWAKKNHPGKVDKKTGEYSPRNANLSSWDKYIRNSYKLLVAEARHRSIDTRFTKMHVYKLIFYIQNKLISIFEGTKIKIPKGISNIHTNTFSSHCYPLKSVDRLVPKYVLNILASAHKNLTITSYEIQESKLLLPETVFEICSKNYSYNSAVSIIRSSNAPIVLI